MTADTPDSATPDRSAPSDRVATDPSASATADPSNSADAAPSNPVSIGSDPATVGRDTAPSNPSASPPSHSAAGHAERVAAVPRARSKKAAAQQRGGGRGSRLSYDDWVDGALTLLAREGVAALKIPRLCEELGVTKGSFYWHFDDVDQLVEAMADRWTATQAAAIQDLGALASLPVEQRVQTMGALLVERNWLTESTVREWARTHPRVAAAVTELDRRIFETIRTAMLELGFDAEAARLRAGAMVYLGIGFIHGRGSLPVPTHREVNSVLELLLRKA